MGAQLTVVGEGGSVRGWPGSGSGSGSGPGGRAHEVEPGARAAGGGGGICHQLAAAEGVLPCDSLLAGAAKRWHQW
jgi:hypothetical protein